MSFPITKATRTNIKPLICFFSESGCGKTYSSLLLARGLVGPTGKIVFGDSESGRGSIYADVIAGGYDTFEIVPPFTPARYIEAIDTIESSGAAVGILDSASHEWEGIGGVLDMAAENEQKSGKAGLHNWKGPKFEHAQFVQRLLRSKVPLIICVRAKFKSRQTKENGKTVIVKDNETSPIQAEDFIFEMTCHGEILQDHSLRLTKVSHPSLRNCFPVNSPITVQTGEALAKWCASPGGSPAASTAIASKTATTTERDTLKKELWAMTQQFHLGVPAKLEQYLWDENLLADTESLGELPPERFREIITKLKTKT